MFQASQAAGLVSRLYLALFFGLHAAHELAPQTVTHFAQHPSLEDTPWLSAALAALLSLIALWLVLGLRSRIVAVLGFVICSATVLLQAEGWSHGPPADFWSWDRLTALGAVLVLAVTGGGLFRLRAGGWRLRDCL